MADSSKWFWYTAPRSDFCSSAFRYDKLSFHVERWFMRWFAKEDKKSVLTFCSLLLYMWTSPKYHSIFFEKLSFYSPDRVRQWHWEGGILFVVQNLIERTRLTMNWLDQSVHLLGWIGPRLILSNYIYYKRVKSFKNISHMYICLIS